MRRLTDAALLFGVVALLFVLFGVFVLAPISWAAATFIHYHMNH